MVVGLLGVGWGGGRVGWVGEWVGGCGCGGGGVPWDGVCGCVVRPRVVPRQGTCKARSEHTKERMHSERVSGSAGKCGA